MIRLNMHGLGDVAWFAESPGALGTIPLSSSDPCFPWGGAWPTTWSTAAMSQIPDLPDSYGPPLARLFISGGFDEARRNCFVSRMDPSNFQRKAYEAWVAAGRPSGQAELNVQQNSGDYTQTTGYGTNKGLPNVAPTSAPAGVMTISPSHIQAAPGGSAASLPVAPSSSWFTGSMFDGVPNWALLAGVAVAAYMAFGGKH